MVDFWPNPGTPWLLSDYGPSYLSAELSSRLAEHGMTHTRGRLYHPMTQGKIEQLPPGPCKTPLSYPARAQ